MPLEKSASNAAVGRNIEREEAAGKPRKQAIAIALSTQREAKDTRIKPNPDGSYVIPGADGRRTVR